MINIAEMNSTVGNLATLVSPSLKPPLYASCCFSFASLIQKCGFCSDNFPTFKFLVFKNKKSNFHDKLCTDVLNHVVSYLDSDSAASLMQTSKSIMNKLISKAGVDAVACVNDLIRKLKQPSFGKTQDLHLNSLFKEREIDSKDYMKRKLWFCWTRGNCGLYRDSIKDLGVILSRLKLFLRDRENPLPLKRLNLAKDGVVNILSMLLPLKRLNLAKDGVINILSMLDAEVLSQVSNNSCCGFMENSLEIAQCYNEAAMAKFCKHVWPYTVIVEITHPLIMVGEFKRALKIFMSMRYHRNCVQNWAEMVVDTFFERVGKEAVKFREKMVEFFDAMPDEWKPSLVRGLVRSIDYSQGRRFSNLNEATIEKLAYVPWIHSKSKETLSWLVKRRDLMEGLIQHIDRIIPNTKKQREEILFSIAEAFIEEKEFEKANAVAKILKNKKLDCVLQSAERKANFWKILDYLAKTLMAFGVGMELFYALCRTPSKQKLLPRHC